MAGSGMAGLAHGWSIQVRVIKALMLRELTTRFGRENIGFLWMMVEPMLFALLVSVLWRFAIGTHEHGIGIAAFTVSAYIPIVLFRHAVNKTTGVFRANGSLMYHRQVKVLDFIFVRFLIEFVGHMMAYVVIGIALWMVDLMPTPYDLGFVLMGWFYWSLFTFAVCVILAPVGEMSELVEKFLPVTTYIMVPLSGAFHLMAWLTPSARAMLAWSPLVHGMEMMRFGLFGHAMTPYYEYGYTLKVSAVLILLGLALCRRVRRNLVVE